MKKICFLFIFIKLISCYTPNNNLPLYNYWNCIGFKNDLKKDKPYVFNVGEIPLIAWKSNDTIISTLNACKHMGSKLDKGKICNGNLLCPYHGIKHNIDDKCGIIKEFDDKLWWSYNPINENIPKIPYNQKDYISSYLTIDMDESLPYAIYNSMDLNHPEFIHNGLGFGEKEAAKNYKMHQFDDKIGISFDYTAKKTVKHLNYDMNIEDLTNNYNEVIYPSTTWSRVSIPEDKEKNIIIGVSMLPIEENLTRWFITIRHNYMTNFIGKNIMIEATKYILNQDKNQFKSQIKNKELKDFVSWKKMLKFENHLSILNKYYKGYNYPKIGDFIEELKKDKW